VAGAVVLSLFPGIDLLGEAFALEGFCVVRGPDPLLGQQSVETFHAPAGAFTGVIGGPPCTGESKLAHLNGTPGYSLRHEFLRVRDEARPAWWVMEAVTPHADLACHIVKLSPRWLGEEQSRVRYFHSNLDLAPFLDVALFEAPVFKHAVLAGHGSGWHTGSVIKGIATYPWEEMCRLQGAPADLTLSGFTRQAARKAVGNAVPLPMGRAIAQAVRRALDVAANAA
jgi:DNA (cytosine-5)-methyltransferase 1